MVRYFTTEAIEGTEIFCWPQRHRDTEGRVRARILFSASCVSGKSISMARASISARLLRRFKFRLT